MDEPDRKQTPNSSDPRIRQIVDRIPHERPLSFRYEMEKFTGDRGALHAAIIDLISIQKIPLAKVHAGMALLCVGHPMGADILLAALKGPEGQARTHAIGELSSMWSYESGYSSSPKEKLPISMQDLAKALVPSLAMPHSQEGKMALEFCLNHACVETVKHTRVHLEHLDLEIRAQIACAFLKHGINQGALATAARHWFCPFPKSPDGQLNWRRVGQTYGASIWGALSKDTLREDVTRFAVHTVGKTLSLPDAPIRTWFNVDHRTGSGFFNCLLGVLSEVATEEAKELLLKTVDAPNVAPYSRANAAYLLAKAFNFVPEGTEDAVVAMVRDKKVSECGRNPLLGKCAVTLGASAISGMIAALQDTEMRRETAQTLLDFSETERTAEINSALQAALAAETRDWAKEDITKTLLKRGIEDEAVVDGLMGWDAMDYWWKKNGTTQSQVASILAAAGAIDPIGEQQLNAVSSKNGEGLILALATHGGEDCHRVAFCGLEHDGGDADHGKLFADLARITRPPLPIESVSQDYQVVQKECEAKSQGLQMWQDGEWKATQEELLGDVKMIVVEEAHCKVRYTHEGKEHSFVTESSGGWLDANAVAREFNELMQRIGREDRVFRLKGPSGNDDWAMFVCANERLFRSAAEELHIPLLETEKQSRDE